MKANDIDRVVNGLRIVICDDNLKRASEIQKLCFTHGVRNARILNKINANTGYDLVFVGGSKATKEFIKPAKGKMPIVFVTEGDTASVYDAYMHGATQVISAPIDTNDVSDCLWSAVRYRGQYAETPEVLCWKQSCQFRSKLA